MLLDSKHANIPDGLGKPRMDLLNVLNREHAGDRCHRIVAKINTALLTRKAMRFKDFPDIFIGVRVAGVRVMKLEGFHLQIKGDRVHPSSWSLNLFGPKGIVTDAWDNRKFSLKACHYRAPV